VAGSDQSHSIRIRGAIALGRARLRATPGGRLGLAAAAIVLLIHAILLVVLRLGDAQDGPLDAALRSAARWLALAAGGPIALAAAHDRAAADRREGIEALAAARGLSADALHGTRSIAAMIEVAAAIAAPAAALAALGALLAASGPGALRLLALGAALAAFAAICGVTLGGLASISGRLAGPRGRSVLLSVLLIPWVLADLAGHAQWSIPGALEAFLSFAVRAAGGQA
jgi:hypothetical protein